MSLRNLDTMPDWRLETLPGGSCFRVIGCGGGDQPGFVCEDNDLHPVPLAELHQQAGDVCLDGCLGDKQVGGYFHKLVDGVVVVNTPAEIDVTVTDQFRAALRVATKGRHPVLVVDMTGTRFCDSAGVHTLAWASERAQAEGGELRLVIPPGGTVPRILKLTGIDRIIPCFTSLAEALATAAGADRRACPSQ